MAAACPTCGKGDQLVPIGQDRAKCKGCGEVFDLPKALKDGEGGAGWTTALKGPDFAIATDPADST
jgi:hypothetical protein